MLLTRTIAVSCLVSIASMAPAQSARPREDAAAAPKPPPGLSVDHLFNGVNRPVMIDVVSPRSFGTVTLQLMDFDGQPIGPPIQTYPGRVDLAEKMPGIWNLRRTAYLQLIDISQPVGSALVLQPMLSRMVPKTEIRTHPVTGNPSTRIVGWIDENDPSMLTPAPPKPAAPPAAQQPTTRAKVPDRPPEIPGQERKEEPPPPPPEPTKPEPPPTLIERVFAGLRIYPERDVVLRTSKGDIRICLKADEAPNTAWNFLELSRGGFYRGVVFHRIVPLTANGLPFVIQAGDPTASGDGGPGYWLPIEDSKIQHDFGVISMARSDDPDSNGSQFFLCLSREGTQRLDGQYCAFGYAVDGAPVIKAIAEVEIADLQTGRPKEPPMIEDAELVSAPPRTPGKGRPDERVTLEAAHRPTTQPTGRVPR